MSWNWKAIFSDHFANTNINTTINKVIKMMEVYDENKKQKKTWVPE